MRKTNATVNRRIEVPVADIIETAVTSSTDSNFMEDRQYLWIPDQLNSRTLYNDVSNSAEPFKPLTEAEVYDLDSRVTLIRAKSKENALKAVEYLAPIHNAKDGIGYDKYVDREEAYSDQPLDCPNLIPVIPAGELISRIRDNPFVGGLSGMNNQVQTAINERRIKRYYDFQKREPVIIIGQSYFFDSFPVHLLGSFSENRRIYICLFGDCQFADSDFLLGDGLGDPDGTDYQVVTDGELELVLAMDAGVITLDERDDVNKRYLLKLLDDIALFYDVKFEKGFNKTAFISRVMEVKKDNRAYMIDKLVHRVSERTKSGKVGKDLFRLIGKLEADTVNVKGWNKIDSLIGCEEIKQKIHNVVDSMTFAQARRLHNQKGLMPCTMVFAGAPGTGKTSVAEALAEILEDQGILQDKRFISICAPQLQAPYLGQSAHRVAQLFAENDVIFIDEAYALAEQKDSLYAREVLAQLCVEIENASKKQNKLVILAGYGGDDSDEKSNAMKRFLEANPGIKSRIAAVVNFRSYSAKECVNITNGIIKNEGYVIGEDEFEAVAESLNRFFEKRILTEGFGNGRECRNTVMHAVQKAASRIVKGRKINEIPEEELKTLKKEDIIGAISEMENSEKASNGKTDARIGFIA